MVRGLLQQDPVSDPRFSAKHITIHHQQSRGQAATPACTYQSLFENNAGLFFWFSFCDKVGCHCAWLRSYVVMVGVTSHVGEGGSWTQAGGLPSAGGGGRDDAVGGLEVGGFRYSWLRLVHVRQHVKTSSRRAVHTILS